MYSKQIQTVKLYQRSFLHFGKHGMNTMVFSATEMYAATGNRELL